jgi:rhamnosyltransferase
MKGAPAVDILLATWNGERYLAEQIDSILAQSYSNWRLLIRDDGSSDGTRDIIRRYVSEYHERRWLPRAKRKELVSFLITG